MQWLGEVKGPNYASGAIWHPVYTEEFYRIHIYLSIYMGGG
jgi:hypothetical protein